MAMNLATFLAAIPALYRSGNALEIESGPGVGKSSTFEQGAAMMSKILGEPFGLVTNILSQMDPIDIKGFCIPVKDPANPAKVDARFTSPTVFPNQYNIEVYVDGALAENWDGPLPQRGILFLDEFGQSSVETQKVAAQLILSKRIGEFRLPKGWVVWSASNRLADKSGVNKRLSFVQNRQKTLPIQPDFNAWLSWATTAGVHPLTITFAKRYPDKVFKDSVPAEPGPYCTPRSLVLCTEDLLAMRTAAHGDMRLPDDSVALEVINGWLGEGTGTAFVSHIRLANELPELEEVIKGPTKTKVPQRADARFVMASMLAHHTTEKNVKPFFTYVQRMDTEMQVLYVYSLAKRNSWLMQDEGIDAWMYKNQDLLQAAYSM